jgi:hypothetical protein
MHDELACVMSQRAEPLVRSFVSQTIEYYIRKSILAYNHGPFGKIISNLFPPSSFCLRR